MDSSWSNNATKTHSHVSYACDQFILSVIDDNFEIQNALDPALLSELYARVLYAVAEVSHKALHTLRILQSSEKVPNIERDFIQRFFDWSPGKNIAKMWGLFDNYDQARASLDISQSQSSLLDTASWSICECPDCFLWLLSLGSIESSGFNSGGQSFFSIAISAGKLSIAEKLISRMTPKQLNQPSMLITEKGYATCFQISVIHEKLFLSCWDKAETQEGKGICLSFVARHLIHICRFADSDLANRMLRRNINLSNAVREMPWLWRDIAKYNPKPESLFSWLQQHDCYPFFVESIYQTSLVVAAHYDGVAAVEWLLLYTNNLIELRQCAAVASRRQTQKSARIFHLTVQSLSRIWFKELVEQAYTITSRIIQDACHHIQGTENVKSDDIENIAIRKLRSLQCITGRPLRYSSFEIILLAELALKTLLNCLRSEGVWHGDLVLAGELSAGIVIY